MTDPYASTTNTATAAPVGRMTDPYATSAPAPTTSSSKGTPITQPVKTTGITTGQPQVEAYSPSTVLPKPSATPSPTPKASYGSSNLTDPYSAKPLLTYENPQAQQSQLLADRTALPFDPTVAQKIDPKVLQNGRMPLSVSQEIKKSLPNSVFDELDHEMPLELGGSNLKGNLQLEPGSNSSKPYSPGKNPTATDSLENALAQQVHSGKISLVDAWKLMAKAKGYKLPEEGGPVVSSQGSGQAKTVYISGEPSIGERALDAYPSTMKALADLQIDPLSLKADPHKIIIDYWNGVKDSVTNAEDAVAKAIVAKGGTAKTGASLSALASVTTGALSPLTSLFNPVNDVPVLGTFSRLIMLPFAFMGDAGQDTAKVLVDSLPLKQETKDKIVGGVGDILALAGQFAIGGAIEGTAGKITNFHEYNALLDRSGLTKGSDLVKEYGLKDATTIVNKAKQIAGVQPTLEDLTKEPAKIKPKAPEVKAEAAASTVAQAGATEPIKMPEIAKPKDTSVTLGSGFDPGVDKFYAEDIKPLGAKVKAVAQTVTETVKRAATAVRDVADIGRSVGKQFGGEAYSDVIRAIHQPEAEAITFDNNFNQAEKWFNKFSPKEIDDFNVTRGNPTTAEGQSLQREATERLPEALRSPEITKAIKAASDHVYKLAKDNGIDLDYFEDYFRGAYKDPAKVDAFMDYWRSTENYTKEKTIPTIADAKSYGLELKDPNPITNIRSELMAVAKRVGLKNLAEKLKADPTSNSFIRPAESLPKELIGKWKKIEDPTFNGLLADPKYAKFVNNLLSANKVSQNFFLKALRQTTFLAQKVKFFGSAFHLQNELKAAIAQEAGGVFDPRGYKDFATSFKKIDTADPMYKDYVNLGGGHKYSIESQALEHRGYVQALDKLERGNYLGGITKVVAEGLKTPSKFTSWMFEDFIPKLKFEKYRQDVAVGEEKLGRTLTDAEKINIIRRNQNFYGEMNERLFGRSGTATSAARLLFTAPGYGEGNFRVLGSSLKDPKSARFIVNTLITTAVVSAIGTRLMSGQWPSVPKKLTDARDLFKIKTSMKDGNGDPVYFDMMTYDKDYWSIYGNLATKQPGNIPSDLTTRVAGMFSPVAKTLTDLTSIVEGKNVVDWKSDPIYYKTDPFAVKLSKFMQYEGNESLPISAGTFGQSKQKGAGIVQSAASAFAGVRPTTSEEVKRLKVIQGEVISMKAEKDKMQITLNKLAAENMPEALRQAKQFNDKQQKVLDGILKDYPKTQFTPSDFKLKTLNPKGKNSGGTSIQGILQPKARTRMPKGIVK